MLAISLGPVILVGAVIVAVAIISAGSATVVLELEASTKAGDFRGDMPCLLKPGSPTCPEPDSETGQCPDGYNLNENEDCYPSHTECPKNTHSEDDDETGACHHDRNN